MEGSGHFELFELEVNRGQAFRDVGPVIVAAHEEHRRQIRGGFNPLRAARRAMMPARWLEVNTRVTIMPRVCAGKTSASIRVCQRLAVLRVEEDE